MRTIQSESHIEYIEETVATIGSVYEISFAVFILGGWAALVVDSLIAYKMAKKLHLHESKRRVYVRIGLLTTNLMSFLCCILC